MAEDNKIFNMINANESFIKSLNDTFNGLESNANKPNSLMKNGKFHDDYADFTEFEDENGNILLIKYDKQEYEFRGNKYCSYILCNEKTGSREEGIAQIKGGQYVRLTDPERIEKIKSYITNEQEEVQKLINLINIKLLVSKLNDIGIYPSDSNIVDCFEDLVTARTKYNGDTFLLFIGDEALFEDDCVVFNVTKYEIVEDSALINNIFDLSKYFHEENKSNTNAKPWWKKW